MDYTIIDGIFQEATKVLNLDSSHGALRDKLQNHISAEHRKANAASESASYYNTPYVRDVYGSETDGHVVHSKDGKLTMSKFKSDGKGGYALSGHKSVKQAYVADSTAEEKNESMLLVLDGKELLVTEAASCLTENGTVEAVELQEAAGNKSAVTKICLITAGRGAMGYYTEAALKKAAKDGIFGKGTQMFLNHQTLAERQARPEGDISKLTGVLTGPAEYVEAMGTVPAKLVAPGNVYPEYKGFIGARKDDIGVSVRVKAIPNGMKDGVPLVESINEAISVDFVTKAGRGGKIEEMYESYRGTDPTRGIQPQEHEMNEQEKTLLAALQESNGKLLARLDRVEEQNMQLLAESALGTALAASGLKPRGQQRVRQVVMASLPTGADGKLDIVKFQETIKTAVADEITYLQESGVATMPKVVRGLGIVPTVNDKGEELSETAVAANASAILSESIGDLLGVERKKA